MSVKKNKSSPSTASLSIKIDYSELESKLEEKFSIINRNFNLCLKFSISKKISFVTFFT